jgi:MFS family permease
LKYFWLFLIIRSLVGIGEASYSCVAPTIIGDLFTQELRTRMLALFYLAVPVGSGLGYIIGSNVTQQLNDWRWSLRVTPPLGFICIILLIILVEEPKRGGAEGSLVLESRTSFFNDIYYLLRKYVCMCVLVCVLILKSLLFLVKVSCGQQWALHLVHLLWVVYLGGCHCLSNMQYIL